MFTIAGSEISVSSLTKDYNGLKINCVALQILDDLDTTSTAQRTVAIDVWCEYLFILADQVSGVLPVNSPLREVRDESLRGFCEKIKRSCVCLKSDSRKN